MKYKVALISPDCLQDLAIQIFHSLLSGKGYDSKCLYIKRKDKDTEAVDLDTSIGLLKQINPDLVGITVKSPYFQIVKALNEKIKKELPNVKTIWGGVHASLLPEECIKYADFVCIGEGEEAFLELVEKLSLGKDTHNIKNIWAREKSAVYKNPIRPLIRDLSQFPLPLLNDGNQFYISNGKFSNTFNLSEWVILSSRGCPFECSYCSNLRLKEFHKAEALRRRSVENVIEEAVLIKSKLKDINLIVFNDDIFTFNRNWIREFAPKYKEKVGIPFLVITHPIFVKEDIMAMLKDAGLHVVLMGIQSGSERVRTEVFNRKTTNRQIIEATEILKKINVPFKRYDMIHDNPYETREDKIETLNLLLQLARPYEMNFFSLIWFPKTQLTERALSEGIVTEEQIEGNCSKSLEQTRILRGYQRTEEDIYFANLYYLAITYGFPKNFVRLITNSRLIERYNVFLNATILFVKVTKGLIFALDGFVKLCKGKGSVDKIWGGLEMLKRYLSFKRYDY